MYSPLPSPALFGVAVLALFCQACQSPAFTAGLAGAQLKSKGSFGATDSGAVIQTSMESLGLAQSDNALLPRLYLRDGPRLLELSGFAVDLEGQGEVETDITIGSTTITANTEVDSQFALSSYSGVLTWDVARMGPTLVGIGVGVEWVSVDVAMQETLGSLSLSSENQFPLPLIGLRVTSDNAPVSGHLSLGWIALDAPEAKAAILDVDARLEAHLVGTSGGTNILGMLGYRGFDMDVTYDDGGSQIEADFKVSGPYAGLRIQF